MPHFEYYVRGRKFQSDHRLSDRELADLQGPSIGPAPEKGIGGYAGDAWRWANTSVFGDLPSTITRNISGSDTRQANAGDILTGDFWKQMWSGLKADPLAIAGGFGQGAVEGSGRAIEQLTTPVNLLPMGLGRAAKAATTVGLPALAKGLTYATRAASLPAAYSGYEQVTDPESNLAEKALGVANIAGGLYGLKYSPGPVQPRPGIFEQPALRGETVPHVGPNITVEDLGNAPRPETRPNRLLPEWDPLSYQDINQGPQGPQGPGGAGNFTFGGRPADIPLNYPEGPGFQDMGNVPSTQRNFPIRPSVRQLRPPPLEGEVLPPSPEPFNRPDIDRPISDQSLNWQQEPGPVGMRPADVADIIRNVTGNRDINVYGPTGEPLGRGQQPPIQMEQVPMEEVIRSIREDEARSPVFRAQMDDVQNFYREVQRRRTRPVATAERTPITEDPFAPRESAPLVPREPVTQDIPFEEPVIHEPGALPGETPFTHETATKPPTRTPFLDPRITSLVPEAEEPHEPPPSGTVGPISTGYQPPTITHPNMVPNIPTQGQTLADQVLGPDVRASIEAAKAQARAEVDRELGIQPETREGITEDKLRQMEGEGPVSEMARPVDENGNPIDVKQWTPEELEVRKRDLAFKWGTARREARELGLNISGMRDYDQVQEMITNAKAEAERQKRPISEMTNRYPSEEGLARKRLVMEMRRGDDEYRNLVEGAPNETLQHIKTIAPELYDEAVGIANETNPERIAENFHRYRKAANKFSGISDRGEAIQALADLASETYERATQRMLGGEDEEGGPISEMRVTRGGYGGDPGVVTNPVTGRPNIAMGGADPQVLKTLGVSLYANEGPNVVTTELLQNASDEKRISGTTAPIRVVYSSDSRHPVTNNKAVSIIVQDGGRGLNEDQLYTIFSDVGKSGKRTTPGASGGFGFAKAAPFLIGDYMRTTTVVNETDGNTYEYTFGGTPKEFMNQAKGVPLNRRDMPKGTPTGTRIEVFFPENQSLYSAHNRAKQIAEFSPGLSGVEIYQDYSADPTYRNKFLEGGKAALPDWARSYAEEPTQIPLPPQVTNISITGSDVGIGYELDDKRRQKVNVVYLNNGMFAFADSKQVSRFPVSHIPKTVVFDIHATVEEGETGYPFQANRESLHSTTDRELDKWIDDNITKPAKARETAEYQRLYDSVKPVGNNRHVVLDSGGKYTPQEMANVVNSPILYRFGILMEELLDELASYFPGPESLGDTQKFGIRVSDPDQGGINIQDPSSGKTIPATANRPARTERSRFLIMINLFGTWKHAKNRDEVARRLFHVIMHEFTHNLARNEGAGYTWKLSLVETKFPTERRLAYENEFKRLFFKPNGDNVDEISQLLREYTDSRGRPESVPDILSRQAESPWLGQSDRTKGIFNNPLSTGEGIFPESEAGDIGGGGRIPPDEPPFSNLNDPFADLPFGGGGPSAGAGGNIPPNQPPGGPPNIPPSGPPNQPPGNIPSGGGSHAGGVPPRPARSQAAEKGFWAYWSAAKSLMSVDLPFLTSAAFRQGRSFIGTKNWFKAWVEQAKAFGSEEAYNRSQHAIENDPLFTARARFRGQTGTQPIWEDSIAGRLGLEMTDINNFARREELFASQMIEKIPGLGKYYRASNRAYTAFLNHLRAWEFKNALEQAGIWDGQNISDIPKAKEIANAINVMTGRGKLELVTGYSQGSKRLHSIEGGKAATVLNRALFSPRLMVANLQMLNPMTYMTASPQVRQMYMKGMLRSVGAWWGIATAAKMFFPDDVEVETDPNSSDYGKIRIGNTRIDPGGGLQQYLVIAHRVAPQLGLPSHIPMPSMDWPVNMEPLMEPTNIGGIGTPIDLATGFLFTPGGGVTRTTGEREGQFIPYGQEFRGETALSDTARFLRNKAHPVAALIYDIADRSRQFPVHLGDRIAQMFLPMATGDIADIIMDDPSILSILGTSIASSVGMGAATFEGGPSKPTLTPAIPETYNYLAGKVGLPPTDFYPEDYDITIE